jgi:hypothetical protein
MLLLSEGTQLNNDGIILLMTELIQLQLQSKNLAAENEDDIDDDSDDKMEDDQISNERLRYIT